MEFTFDLGILGWAALIVGALVVGVAGQLIGQAETGFEWLITTVGAFIGGFVASEFVIAWRAIDPVWEGLALIPAIGGLLVAGIVVEIVTRLVTGGHYFSPSAA